MDTMDNEELRELRNKVVRAGEGLEKVQWRLAALLDQLDKEKGDEHLPDDKREQLREFLADLSDADLVVQVLSAHKLLEWRSHGRSRFLAEIESTMLTSVLERFAPLALVDGLAIYEEHAIPIEDFVEAHNA